MIDRIPYLVFKPRKSGGGTYHWEPSAALKRNNWPAMALGTDRDTAMAAARKRNTEVEIWRTGGAKPREVRALIRAATLAAGIARYRRDALHDPALTPAENRRQGRVEASTSKTYRTALTRLEAWAGKHPLDYVTPARVRALRDAMMDPDLGIGHHAAHSTLRMGRTLFKFLIACDLVPRGQNPFTDFGLGAPPPRTQLWEHDDEGAFRAVALDMGAPSMALAMELAIYTAQREADLTGFTEHQFRPIQLHDPVLHERLADADGVVMGWVLRQSKTKMPLQIPFDLALRARVEAALRHNRARDRTAGRLVTHVIVNDASGEPWQQRHFIRTWGNIRDAAAERLTAPHIADLHWHDLRRTRVVRLRRMGFRSDQIATLTGTSPKTVDKMLEVYGPIDPTMTANTIVASLDAEAARAARDEQRKEAQG